MILRMWRNCIRFTHQRLSSNARVEGRLSSVVTTLPDTRQSVNFLTAWLSHTGQNPENWSRKKSEGIFSLLPSHHSLCCFPNSDSVRARTQRVQSESINLLPNRCILIKRRFPPLEVDGFEFPIGTAWKRNYTFSKAVWYTVLILEFMFFLDYKIKVALLYSVHVSCI